VSLLLEGGAVRCFGSNNRGQCNVPAPLASGAVQTRQLAAGHEFT
jgi:hypothetical protein